jgi:hypothetical protein
MWLSTCVALAMLQAGGPPWLTGESRPEDLKIWMVTFGPGDTVPEWWGHTALAVQDTAKNQGRLYNYGMFSFDEGFLARFVQGRLEFWVADDGIAPTFLFYRQLGRDVRIQELDLTPEQAQTVARTLANNVLPQNRNYLYDHYRDNCSTRPRDIIDGAVGGQLGAATAGPARFTFRELTRKYSRVNPPMSFLLDFMQNDRLDKPMAQRGEAFLPDELERQVQALQLKGPDGASHPAVKRQWDWFKSKRAPVPDQPPQWIPWLLLMGLATAGTVLGLGHWAAQGARLPRVLLGVELSLLSLTLGLLGTTLALAGLFTDQLVTHHNENLFLANPADLIALPASVLFAFGARRGRPTLRWMWALLGGTSVLGIGLKVLPWFDQQNWNCIALVAPINWGVAALFWLEHRRNGRSAKLQGNP